MNFTKTLREFERCYQRCAKWTVIYFIGYFFSVAKFGGKDVAKKVVLIHTARSGVNLAVSLVRGYLHRTIQTALN